MGTRELIAIALVACSGPRPAVEAVLVAPGPPGYQRVSIDLRNTGGGHGEVELDIELVSPTRRISADRRVELQAQARVQLFVDVAAPADTYTVTVESVYPN